MATGVGVVARSECFRCPGRTRVVVRLFMSDILRCRCARTPVSAPIACWRFPNATPSKTLVSKWLLKIAAERHSRDVNYLRMFRSVFTPSAVTGRKEWLKIIRSQYTLKNSQRTETVQGPYDFKGPFRTSYSRVSVTFRSSVGVESGLSIELHRIIRRIPCVLFATQLCTSV